MTSTQSMTTMSLENVQILQIHPVFYLGSSFFLVKDWLLQLGRDSVKCAHRLPQSQSRVHFSRCLLRINLIWPSSTLDQTQTSLR